MWVSFCIGVAGSIVGGVIVGLPFYFLGGRQLNREARRMRKLILLIARAFEESGLAIFKWDSAGEPVGLVILRGFSAGMSPMAGTLDLEVKHNPAPPQDPEEPLER